jgi:hypothetical protein
MNARLCATFFLLLTSIAFGQSDRGAITGTVRDQSGGVVPEAKVTVTNVSSGEVRHTTSGSEGSFHLPELKAATYKLFVEAQGFKSATIDEIQVGVQTTRRAEVTLEPGDISESVPVTADIAPTLQTDTPVQQLNVTERQVRELPLAVAQRAAAAHLSRSLGRAYSRLKRTADAEATLATYTRLSEGQKEQEARRAD